MFKFFGLKENDNEGNLDLYKVMKNIRNDK